MYYGSMINKDYPGYVQENGFSCQGNFTKGFYISKFINKKIFPKLTVSAQIEQRCSNFRPGFFGAVAFKFGKSAVIIKMLF